MGKRGPKPKPTAVRIFEGNPSKRPLNKSEPVAPISNVEVCPEWLVDMGRDKWNEVAPMLAAMRVLTDADRDCLSAYCEAWHEFFEALAIIRREGIVAFGEKGGPYTHPAVNIKSAALNRIKVFGSLLGLNPVSRMSLNTPPSDGKSDFERESEKYA